MDKFYKPNTIAILFNEKLNECELLANKIKNDIKDDFEVFVQNTALSLENGLPSNPDLFPNIPLSLKKINPAIIANKIMSMYSKL